GVKRHRIDWWPTMMKPTFGSTWQESPPTCVHDCGAWAAAAFAEARKIVDNKIEGPAWTILSSWARLTPAGACKLMPAITTRSGRTGHWIKVRRSPVRFSRPEALNRTLSLVDFITITFESRFSVHTGIVPIGLAVGATEFLRVRSGRTPTRPVPSRHHSFIFLVLGFSILARSCEAMILAFKSAEYAADYRFTGWFPLTAFVFLLAHHGIALLASTHSSAKGVCLFSFIVPELDLHIRIAATADKLGASWPLCRLPGCGDHDRGPSLRDVFL